MDIQEVAKWVETNAPEIELREYQVEAWQKLWNARIHQKKERGLIHLATGLGKTSVATVDVLHYLREENPNARIMFVAHMREISVQAEASFKRLDDSLSTTVFSERTLHDAQITFAMFQGLHLSLDLFDPYQFDYIIWDEVHHIEAPTFTLVRDYFKPKFQLGLTATPQRADGLDITDHFGEPLFKKSFSEGLAEGWLSPVDYHIVFDKTIKDAIAQGFKLQNKTDIRLLFAIPTRNEVISKEVMKRRQEIGLNLAQTIVFCQNIASGKAMAKLLGGEVYHSKVKIADRRDIFDRFKSGSLKVICTVDMFNEGIDIPNARLLVFLRSTASRTIFEQQLGRGLRRHPGKKKVTVLDFAANIERINFVKELYRHNAVTKSHSGGYAIDEKDPDEDRYFDVNSFEFEDEVVQLLEKYGSFKLHNLDTNEIVKVYMELGKNGVATAKHFGVTENAIYKHLKKANIDSSGHIIKELTDAMVAEVYYRLRSAKKAGKELGIDSSTVLERLKRGNYERIVHHPDLISDEELLRIYEEAGSVRATADEIGRNRAHVGKRLKSLKVKVREKNIITSEALAESYQKNAGDIMGIVEDLKTTDGSKGVIRQWNKVYQALDKYGYIENYDGKVTSARAAAAWYKYGTATKAGEILGVSNVYVSRMARNARHIKKYKKKAVK